MSVAEAKNSLRISTRAAVSELDEATRESAGATIVRMVADHPVWTAAKSVMLFSPLPDEPPIGELLSLGLRNDKTVCLPRYLPESDRYEAARVRDIERDLITARFGILEPTPTCPAISLNQLDLVFVPGVAFAPCGARLGRGRGFYDRILAAVTGERIGVGFSEQLLAEIPMEEHDARLTGVVTPQRGWLRVENGTA